MWDVHCGTWQPNQKATCRRPCQALYATLYADENGWNGSQEEEIPFNIFTPLRPWSLLTFVCFTCLSSCLHCTFSMSYFVLFFFFFLLILPQAMNFIPALILLICGGGFYGVGSIDDLLIPQNIALSFTAKCWQVCHSSIHPPAIVFHLSRARPG